MRNVNVNVSASAAECRKENEASRRVLVPSVSGGAGAPGAGERRGASHSVRRVPIAPGVANRRPCGAWMGR